MRRRLRRAHRRHEVARARAPGHPGARTHRTPRRLRLRPGNRRRRRHPDPAARRFLRREAEQLGIELPPPAPTRRAWSSCRRSRGRRVAVSRASSASSAKGQRFLGWRDVPVNRRPHRPHRARSDAADPPGLRRRGARPRPGRLRAQALRDPPRRSRARREGARRLLLRAEPVEPHDRLHGHADVDPDRAASTRISPIRRVRVGARARALALQHQHVSRPGTSRSRSATWRTTARSTRCAATSTGCTRARARCARRCFGDDLQKLFPIMRDGARDSAQFDNVLEFLVLHGPRAARSDPDDDPRGVGESRRRWTRSGAPSTSTTRS